MMIFIFLIGFLFAIVRGLALHSADVVMFATLGDSVTLPCAGSRGSRCSSASWTRRDGQSMSPNTSLATDCSLHISYMENNEATIYTCYNGRKNSSVDLQFLSITENKETSNGLIELHCHINNYKGLITPCNKIGLELKWLVEENTRFRTKNVSNCFEKLFIQPKKTDHHRRWKCQVSLNGTAEATTSHLTTLTDGIEEVFAAVSQSVSLTCSNASSLALTGNGQTPTSFSNTGSTTIIRNVHASNSGEYQCVEEGNPKTIWLHTVDIISEMDPKGNNVTLSCVLTCADTTCDKDFSLTWSEDDTLNTTSHLSKVNRTLISKLSLPLVQLGPDDIVCSVLREGVPVATKKWRYSNSLRGLIWIISVPLALLCIVVVVALYKKRKHNKEPENLQANIDLAHVYETVDDNKPNPGLYTLLHEI